MRNNILIVRGDDTSFDGGSLCTIKIISDTSLVGYSASLQIGTVLITYPDVSSGEIVVNLSSTQTSQLLVGDTLGRFVVNDENNKPKLVCNIPFVVVDNLPTWKVNNPDIHINLISVEIIHNSRMYSDLKELPTLNNEEILGNKTASDYGVATPDDIEIHNTSTTSHQDIRDLINQLDTRVSELEEMVNQLRLINNI